MSIPSRPKPVVLAILDGWGISPYPQGNAILEAATPTIDHLSNHYLATQLIASGEAVGLPKGEDGNTETGHLNLGAGSIVYQDLPRINQAIADGTFFTNQEFSSACQHSLSHQSTIHLIGLIGSGGVHSSIDHLHALLNVVKQQGLTKVALHLITDGRDSPPTSSINFIPQIHQKLKELGIGHIASIMGRYYAMDRDRRWDRTEIAYRALTQSQGQIATKPEEAILQSYQNNITDEFIKPILIPDESGQPVQIKAHDAVIFFNFRIDRPRQLTKAFVYPNLEYVNLVPSGFDPYAIEFQQSHLTKQAADTSPVFTRGELIPDLYFVTMTEYEKGIPAHVAFPPHQVEMPLGKVVADMGLRQLRMSETEKERFVTYYFNGQREDPYVGEDRIIIPSPFVPTYDQLPQMSANEMTTTLLERIATNLYDFIIINFANADMVGHTGNFESAKIACQVIDQNIKRISDVIFDMGGVLIITADHGNAEEMINLTNGQVDTEHSTYPVPLIIAGKGFEAESRILPPGMLADVAPTILDIMQLPIPTSMSGRPLTRSIQSVR